MSATATEPRTGRRRGPDDGRGLRAVENGSNGGRPARPVPADLDAERALIGAMLIAGGGSAAVEVAMATVTPADFWSHTHGEIVSAIYALALQGRKVDPLTVADQLRKADQWTDQLGPDLISMQVAVPSIGAAGDYASIVKTMARRRQMKSVAAALDDAADVGDEEAVERALENAHDVVAGGRPELTFEDLGAVLRGEVPELLPTMLMRSDGQALLYPGLLHWVMGEPGCGKTWLALVAVLAEAMVRVPVMYLDYEGSRRIVGHRLARIGATETDVEAVDYARPAVGSTQAGAAAVRRIREHGHRLVVIDGAAKSMAHDGVDEDKASDVLGWMERLVWPLCAAGAAVLVLDHVPKDKDARGRWARGSGAKLGEVDGAAYALKVGKAWSRSTAGYALVEVAKDREGVIGAQGETAAVLRMAPASPELAKIDPPERDTSSSGITVVDVVLAVLQAHRGQELSQAQLETAVRARGSYRATTVRSTADSLVDAGKIRRRFGQRNARMYSSVEGPEQGTLDPSEEDF